jgi:phosphatidylinositol-3-phosphatase
MRSVLAWSLVFGLGVVAGCGSSSSDKGLKGSGGSTASGGEAGTGVGGATGGAAGAGGATGGSAGVPSGGGTAGAGATGGGSGNAIKTVFVIILENKAWCEIQGSPSAPYINDTLLPNGAFAANYSGPLSGGLHPSEPNYIWMEAGDTLGITNDNDPKDNHRSTIDHLATYLDKIGVSWKSYQEDISGTECPLSSSGNYAAKHNPNVFFDDSTGTNDPNYPYCIQHNRPLPELDSDLAAGTVAQYNFIIPNQCNDMHSPCAPLNDSQKQGDNWLAQWVPKIQASSQYQNGGALLITFDEAESTILGGNACCILANCPIGLIALSPLAKVGYKNNLAYDHSSLLKSLQEIFGSSPLLGHAADAGVNDLADLFTAFP